MENPSMKNFSLGENTIISHVRQIAHVNLLVCVPLRARAIARISGNSMNSVGGTKCQAVENDKRGKKEYIKESNSGTNKDIIKIKLHSWELKDNYEKKGLYDKCSHSCSKCLNLEMGEKNLTKS